MRAVELGLSDLGARRVNLGRTGHRTERSTELVRKAHRRQGRLDMQRPPAAITGEVGHHAQKRNTGRVDLQQRIGVVAVVDRRMRGRWEIGSRREVGRIQHEGGIVFASHRSHHGEVPVVAGAALAEAEADWHVRVVVDDTAVDRRRLGKVQADLCLAQDRHDGGREQE